MVDFNKTYFKDKIGRDHSVSQKPDEIITDKIIILIVVCLVLILIILFTAYFILKRVKRLPEVEVMNSKHQVLPLVIEKEMENTEIKPDKVNQLIANLISNNEDNNEIIKGLKEEEKVRYVQQASEEFASAIMLSRDKNKFTNSPKRENSEEKYEKNSSTWNEFVRNKADKIKQDNKEEIQRYNNPLLHPSRTLLYNYLILHLKEFEDITNIVDLSDEERNSKINNLLESKMKYFINHLDEVYKHMNSEINSIIQIIKRTISDKLFIKLISSIWQNETLGLFAVWNGAILTDLYYSVVGKTREPTFYQSSNFNKSKEGLERRWEILAYFWSWVLFLSSYYSMKNEEKVKVFRGLGFRLDTIYDIGEDYRFVTFQSWYTDINRAARFMYGAEPTMYVI